MNEFKVIGFLEPLYLCKTDSGAAENSGKSSVFVAPFHQQYLKPYQKDGIRFLYKQYCKKQPGVILNDGPGHGKTVQILLFLSAINVLLRQQPSLIICNSKNIHHWKYHICTWIENGKDLIGEPDNVFAKKLYFIATIQDLDSISRREWAALVVDNIELPNFIKKCHLIRAKYKIWKSNRDLTSDLVSLNQIYHWFAPQERTNLVSKFSTTGLDRKAAYGKKLDLQTFCDALLLRRDKHTSVPLIDTELHNKLFQQWLEETYGSKIPNAEPDRIDRRNANDNNELQLKIENDPSSSHWETKSPKQLKDSVTRLIKNKKCPTSESPESKKIKLSSLKNIENETNFKFLEDSVSKNEIREIEKNNEFYNRNEIVSSDVNNSENDEVCIKKIIGKSKSPKNEKLSLSKSSKDEKSFEFLKITAVQKNEIVQSENELKYKHHFSDVEKNNVISEINNEMCENDEVHTNEITEKSVTDIDFNEISFASTSRKNYSFREENSHSILESVLFPSKTPERDTKNANLNTIITGSEMKNKSTQNFKISPRNVKDAVKKVEEISNKQFKGTYLDSLF